MMAAIPKKKSTFAIARPVGTTLVEEMISSIEDFGDLASKDVDYLFKKIPACCCWRSFAKNWLVSCLGAY
jgi:hypothetical protein